jgi:tetratricopeptide (TPR) repeat protein
MTTPSIDARASQGFINNPSGDVHQTFVTQAAAEPPLWSGVPHMPPHFVGRDELLNDLVARLLAGHSPALSADGLPGVGKTTLALAIAHHPRVLAHFSDGVLWAGLGRTADVASIQASWGDALHVEVSDLADLRARSQRLHAAIGQHRLLVVLDDAWQWQPLELLRCPGPHVAHLLTTRNQELARRFAGPSQSVSVPTLEEEPGFTLLQSLAPEACASDPAAARALAVAVGGLPLALELLGGYLAAGQHRRFASQRSQALADLTNPAQRLALATQRLGDGSSQIVTLEQTIALSLEELPAQAVAAFECLGAFAPKPARFDLAAAQAVTQADAETLALLADRSLLEIAGDESLALHQVLADAARVHTPPDADARQRNHYLAIVDADRHDWQRIDAVYPQVLFAWQQCAQGNPALDDLLPLVWGLRIFQERRGLWQDSLNWADRTLALTRKVGRTSDSATLLNNMGGIYSALGDKEQALSFYNQALLLRRQVGDKTGEARTLNNIGRVYSDLGDKQQALTFYNQALPLMRQAGDKAGEATTLNNLGGVYSDLGDKQQALSFYNQALLLRRQVGDKTGEARTLNNIGRVYSDLGDKQQALTFYNQALPLMRQAGDKAGEATTLNNLGGVYSDLGDKQQALSYYNQALPLIRQVGDKAGEASTLNNLGLVYDALGDKQQALTFYNQALPLRRQVGDKAGEATTLSNIGAVYSALGDKQQALSFYNQALPLRRQVGDKAGEAATLNNIGAVYFALGDKPQALSYYNQALPLIRQVGDKAGEAATLNNIGRVYDALGDKQQALTYYNQALPLWRQVGDKAGEARTLNNIGLVYSALGDKQQALTYYNQALPLQRQVGDKAGEATTLSNIGAVYFALGDKQQALTFYNQALPLQQQVGDKAGEATTLNNLGFILFQDGKYTDAVALLEQVITILHSLGAVAEEAAALRNLAWALGALNRPSEAAALLERSVAILQRYHLPQDAWGQTLQQHQDLLDQVRRQSS